MTWMGAAAKYPSPRLMRGKRICSSFIMCSSSPGSEAWPDRARRREANLRSSRGRVCGRDSWAGWCPRRRCPDRGSGMCAGCYLWFVHGFGPWSRQGRVGRQVIEPGEKHAGRAETAASCWRGLTPRIRRSIEPGVHLGLDPSSFDSHRHPVRLHRLKSLIVGNG